MPNDKICALSVRRLKPGSWEAFRAGWDAREQGGDHPPFISKITHLRSADDPDVVVSFGLAEGDRAEMAKFLSAPEWRELDQRRHAAMAPHVEETIVDGVFDIIEEIVPAELR
jgi:hypothetical protein